ncbi:MAG: alpha/beta hydrolase [Phycisphaerales bacterium]
MTAGDRPAASVRQAPARGAGWVRRGLRTLLMLAVLVYLGWCVTLYVMQDAILYQAAQAGMPWKDAAIAGLPRLVRMQDAAPDGTRTEAWLFATDQGRSRGLVVFFHGNAELIQHALYEAREWNQRGYDVLLPEYRGYGLAPGKPSQAAIVADSLRALRQAAARTGATHLILHGRSLGTGVAAQVAAAVATAPAAPGIAPSAAPPATPPATSLATPPATPPAAPPAASPAAPLVLDALVLESPFASVAGFAHGYGVPEFLVSNPYRTNEVLPALQCPILILHARHDEMVPFEQGQSLAALNPRARLVEMEGSHNSGLSQDAVYWAAVDDLLKQLPPGTPAQPSP